MPAAESPSRPPSRGPSPRDAAFCTPEPYRPGDNVVCLMRRLLGSVGAHVQHELDPRGLTTAQWIPLYKLHLGHATTAAVVLLTPPVWLTRRPSGGGGADAAAGAH